MGLTVSVNGLIIQRYRHEKAVSLIQVIEKRHVTHTYTLIPEVNP